MAKFKSRFRWRHVKPPYAGEHAAALNCWDVVLNGGRVQLWIVEQMGFRSPEFHWSVRENNGVDRYEFGDCRSFELAQAFAERHAEGLARLKMADAEWLCAGITKGSPGDPGITDDHRRMAAREEYL